ncbi:class I SAM-dependent methyltransferase [Echinicola vietnamensis]|uniref:Methylase involved in ubiquinone/menaquinone biosynthesis n=1 Tax=Echinicola vietnamensis (strain DSM 17526 / LMG 23754 / KMM 6221) TaxID=926556 RepID=L0FVI6_ECHVK|nr:class I SAM-dependent methyltransferase [Echinicola vietnamensis]AGA77013.1 methylase involved in ubiquinone/menaquinone biosynthesis [Echinicola vietnamensis DSM 17526]
MKKNLYDKVAFFYDQLAMVVLGKTHRESKFTFLEYVMAGDRVLYIGGGTGENLSLLAEKVGAEGKVFFVEASQKMMSKAKGQLTAAQLDRVVFLHQTDFDLLPAQQFDWVITQYLLDVLGDRQIDGLFKAINDRIKPSARWILVDFFDRPSMRWLQWMMIWFFRLVTANPRKNLPRYHQFFQKHGWQQMEEMVFKAGWIKAVVLQKSSRQ